MLRMFPKSTMSEESEFVTVVKDPEPSPEHRLTYTATFDTGIDVNVEYNLELKCEYVTSFNIEFDWN